MDTELLSATPPPNPGSFIADTTAEAAHRRGEEILGLPVVKDKVWNLQQIITPGEAKMILLAMPKQRHLRPGNVKYFKDLISAGRFRVTHQGIAFDKAGKLIDGQHRLTACVEADAAIEVQVTFNMDPELFDSIDRGQGRNATDDLVCAALAESQYDGNLLVGAAKIIWHIESGRVPWTSVKRGDFSMDIMRGVLMRHEYLYDAVSYAGKHQLALRGMGASVAAAFYALFREINPHKADIFIEQIVTGENLRHGDPAYALREYKRHTGSAQNKQIRSAMMVVLVRCWNAFVEGRPLGKATSVIKGEANFPVISKGK
jgi:hypothetical protein